MLLTVSASAQTLKVFIAKDAAQKAYYQPGQRASPRYLRMGAENELDLSAIPPGETGYIVYEKEGFLPARVPISEPETRPEFLYEEPLNLQLEVFPSDAKLYNLGLSSDKKNKSEHLVGKAPFTFKRKPYYKPKNVEPWSDRVDFELRRKGFKRHRFNAKPDELDKPLPAVEMEPGLEPLREGVAPDSEDTDLGLSYPVAFIERWGVYHRERFGKVLPAYLLLGLGVLSVPVLLWSRRRRKGQQKRLDILAAFKESEDTKDPNLQKVVGRYRLIGRLGRGGMAIVYKAVPDETLEVKDQIALKLMSPELAQDEDFRARFKREVEVSCSLRHPNIVRLDDWGEEDGLLYLVMEVVQGDTFKGYMKKPMELDMFLNLFGQACKGLTYAHEQGIIHRDLKPANIMVNHKGIVKIMDLGLAKSIHPDHDVTKTGEALGTPAYMPPEQISGMEMSPATDQYAMGVMAFEMLVGRLPFEGKPDDPMALILQHLNEKPPPIREWRPKLPQAIEQIINRMLEKKPEDRYPSMAEVQQALEEAVEVGDSFATQVMETPRE